MLKKALSLIFVLVLMTPAAVWLATGFLVETPPNPSDAGLPWPYGMSFLKNDYYRALDRYLNEHFIFRDRLVAVKNRIELKLFGRTGHPDVHVGRAGWLYPRTDIETFLQDHRGDAGSVAKLHLDLKALEKVVRASGRRFRFLVMPSKASIYPEYIGWVSLPADGRYNAYDRFRAINRHDPLQSWQPLTGQLLDRKIGPHRLYEPADSYWNIHGAGVAADHLYQEIEEAVLSEPLKGPLKHTGNLEDLILNPVPSPSDRAVRRLAGYHASGYGRTLAYGEGSLEPLVPYLQQMVQQLDIVPPDAIPNEEFGEDWRTYDSVLIQTTESELQDLRIDLDPILDQLWDEVWPMDRMPLDLSAIKPINKIALQLGDRGLEIKSLGEQSRFALVVPGSYQHCFRILRLDLTALQPDTLSVSYPLTPSYVSKKALHPERFNLYLPLPVHSRFALKFQPGSRAGLLILHQAEIIGFPSGVDACGQKTLGRHGGSSSL